MTFPIIPASTVNGAYQISRSLRFRSSASAYLSRTFGTATSATIWTWSGWVKRGALGATQALFGAYTDANNFSYFMFNSSDQLRLYVKSATVVTGDIATTAVYRDTSAWCHVLLSKTGTTFSLYVNGVSVSWSGTAPPSTGIINNATPHYLGQYGGAGTYLDGYLAEVNFIDGQALTPSSFGAFDTNGVWQPKAYTGTYGTNGFYLPFSATPTSSYSASFNGSSQYLTSATNAGLGLGTSDFTIECWIQPSAGSAYTAVGFGNGATTYDAFPFYMSSGNLVTYLSSTASSWDVSNAQVIATSIPTTTWSHVALTRSGSTFRAYFNGVQAYTFTSSASIYQSTNAITIAKGQGGYYFAGSISNLRFVKGTALYTSNFTPPVTALTAVTNTQLLTLQNTTIVDNSSNALSITNTGTVTTSSATPWSNYIAGQDSSGAGNNWKSANVNVTSSGTTYDSMIDSPTNYADGGNGRGNYCTWNPVYKNATVAATDGNLSANSGATSSTHRMIFGTLGFTTASYFEITTSGGSTTMVSIVGAGQATTGTADGVYVGSFSKSFGLGYATNAASWYATGATNANGAATNLVDGTWGFAVDPANGKAWVRNTSGNWIGGGDPAAGTLPTFTWTSDGLPWFPIMSFYNVATTFVGILNAGQRSYAFTAPSGFSALNTQNLPTPTITAGNKYFDAATYAGAGTTQSVTNSGSFQPDLVWLKSRSTAYSHYLYDGNRGVTVSLSTDSTGADQTIAQTLTSFNSNGFTLGTVGGAINGSGQNFISWQWKAGGTGVSNTSGSITSTVSANTSAGFSVVTAQSASTTGSASVGHGLGVTPSMVIFKNRDIADDWYTWHVSLGSSTAGNYIRLNTTAAATSSANIWGGTGYGMTSTTLGFNQSALFSASNQKFVFYAFAPIASYSSFGSYTANASTDGPMVFTNFRPRFVLLKNTTRAADWIIYDSSRDLYNTETQQLYPNLSSAEASGANIDFLSNGFKIRAGSGSGINNTSGDIYVYAAFAENPFKTARAR